MVVTMASESPWITGIKYFYGVLILNRNRCTSFVIGSPTGSQYGVRVSWSRPTLHDVICRCTANLAAALYNYTDGLGPGQLMSKILLFTQKSRVRVLIDCLPCMSS